jgi:hypothetical protein
MAAMAQSQHMTIILILKALFEELKALFMPLQSFWLATFFGKVDF